MIELKTYKKGQDEYITKVNESDLKVWFTEWFNNQKFNLKDEDKDFIYSTLISLVANIESITQQVNENKVKLNEIENLIKVEFAKNSKERKLKSRYRLAFDFILAAVLIIAMIMF